MRKSWSGISLRLFFTALFLPWKYRIFKELETNPELFSQVKVEVGGYGISWNDALDLVADGMDMEITIEFVRRGSKNRVG